MKRINTLIFFILLIIICAIISCSKVYYGGTNHLDSKKTLFTTTTYDTTGIITGKYFFLNFGIARYTKNYFGNGQLKTKGWTVRRRTTGWNCRIHYSKIGKWKEWTEDGKLLSVVVYKKDTICLKYLAPKDLKLK